MDLNDLMADVKYASAMQMETPDPQQSFAKARRRVGRSAHMEDCVFDA